MGPAHTASIRALPDSRFVLEGWPCFREELLRADWDFSIEPSIYNDDDFDREREIKGKKEDLIHEYQSMGVAGRNERVDNCASPSRSVDQCSLFTAASTPSMMNKGDRPHPCGERLEPRGRRNHLPNEDKTVGKV